ncbi:MAG: protein translocase subunit SecD [Solirubrobacteraceae bacterium]
MTDRRRNFFILLLVGVLLGGSIAVALTKPTRQGLDLKGGIELVYQAKPTKFSAVTGDAIERTLDIMRDRVDQLGVAEPEIQRSGNDQLVVSLPDVKNQERAIAQVGTTAQMFFYDWEPNVLGSDCKPAEQDPNITGGPSAGNPGAGTLSYYGAVVRASKCPEHSDQNTSQDAPVYFLVDDDAQRVLGGPEVSRDDLFSELEPPQDGPKAGQSVKEVKPGTVVIKAQYEASGDTKAPADPNEAQYYVLNDNFALRGTDIKDPEQTFDNGTGGSGSPIVTFNFTDSGRKTWQTVTRQIVQRGQDQVIPGSDPANFRQHFAVVLDNELISVPYIDFVQNPDGIDGANGSQIEGGFTITSAQNLANLLKSGALPIRLELISSSQVSATLGQEALHQGLKAGIAGFVIVALFLLIFYRVMGLIAVGALVVYGIYLFALIKLIPITLTLPGIAGLILTIGVAADANIVIFERVKEEIRAGRSVPAGIAQGFKKGLSAIIDANVLVFLTAFILFILATAGVKGFAFVLGVGTLVSLFTAVLATQAVLGTLGHTGLMRRPSALGSASSQEAKPDKRRFDFMGSSRWFFSASGVILLVGALAIGEKGLDFGIDFESGTRIRVALTKPADEAGVRTALEASGQEGAEIQRVSDKELGGNAFQISTATLKPDQVTSVTDALQSKYGLARPPDSQSVGPTFGNTVAKSAIIAIIASLFVISCYIALRFEWKYAVPVLIAVMHDILITAGVYSLTDREVTTSTVAALLTILGYSLYDTIIVFDRIRENVPRMPRAAFSQIVNRSMSEVVVRSLATSFCTALPILALLIFGGQTLTDFAFALLVGVLSGAYSSIFIASPVLTHWKEREHVYVTRRRRIAEANGGAVPAYATGNAATEVTVQENKRRQRRLTEPELPGQPVSQQEFQAMLRDIDTPVATAEPEDTTSDLRPDQVVMPKDAKTPKPKRSRNKRHGRSR